MTDNVMSLAFKAAISVALALTLASIVFLTIGTEGGRWMVVFLFLLPLLWLTWLACAIFWKKVPVWKLVSLWGLIDITSLAVLTFLLVHARNTPGPNGGDVAFIVAFSPIVLPSILVNALVPGDFLWIDVGKWGIHITSFDNVIGIFSDWINFSFVSAIPSFIVLAFARLWKKRVSNA